MQKIELTEEMTNDRALMLVAVSSHLIYCFNENHIDWLDKNGMTAFYQKVIEIVDEMMFSEGSAYLEYLKAEPEDKADWFIHNQETCMDWYFMKKAEKIVEKMFEV